MIEHATVVITDTSSGIGRALAQTNLVSSKASTSASCPLAIPVEQAAREVARLIGKRVKSGVVPAFPWKLLLPFFGHLPERFTRVQSAHWQIRAQAYLMLPK